MNTTAVLKGGVLFGIGMMISALIGGADFGPSLIAGLISGAFFGSATYLVGSFLLSRTKIDPGILLEGETVLHRDPANWIIRPKDFKMKNIAFDSLMWVVGMKDKEGVGGVLYVTNYRLIFQSHQINRIRGTVSIFFPTISAIDDGSTFLSKKIFVQTQTVRTEFVVSDFDKVVFNFNRAKNALTKGELVKLQLKIKAHPEKCGNQLNTWKTLNRLNNLLVWGKDGNDVITAIKDPLEAINSFFLKELFEVEIAEKWQKVFPA